MNPLVPPTDNLYKFIAIAGLLLIILGVSIPVTLFNEYLKLERPTQVEAARLEAKYREDRYAYRFSEDYKNEIKKDRLVDRQLYEQRFRENMIAEAINNAQIQENKRLFSSVMYTVRFGAWCVMVGGLLTIGGFILWFFRVQIYQDQILLKDSEVAKQELAQLRTKQEPDTTPPTSTPPDPPILPEMYN